MSKKTLHNTLKQLEDYLDDDLLELYRVKVLINDFKNQKMNYKEFKNALKDVDTLLSIVQIYKIKIIEDDFNEDVPDDYLFIERGLK